MSLICGIIVSAVFMIAACAFSSEILGLYTKDTDIISAGKVYFRIIALSYIPMAVSSIISVWLRCKDHASIPFFASFGAVVVNTGLNYLLIFGGGIIRSGGNTKIIMIIDVVGTWCIGIPLCLLAAYVFKWGIIGVYTLLTTEEIFRLVISLAIFKKRKWMISLS